jgi:redox-sensitive bicupin YhaK (pirin superfamily)
MTTAETVHIRRADQRMVTKTSWLELKHSFPFGADANPRDTHHWTLTGQESHSQPVHFVQMWVVPDEAGVTPGYQQLEIDDALLRGALVTIAAGMPNHRHDAAITIRNRYAALHGARLQAGDSVELPQAPYLHLFVPHGQVALEGAGPLHEGDALRLTASGGQRVTATETAEILVWEMHARLRGV